MMIKRTILVVDEEQETRELFREVLEGRGYDVITCESGEMAVRETAEHAIFAAFVDIRMPGTEGIETLKRIKKIRPATEVVMITDYSQHTSVDEALRLGCFVCMMKPFKLRDVIGVLEVLEAGLDDDLPMAA